ncbi:putative dna topoisomerase ii protein [Neofusicoccum parvum UCRNP2]|uniref:DNA topoisomerase 2 n=1 Tax=Botryosphaeria parva (strain UCR-NP2) TaxID=1287680 RepID=R1E6Z3_BOTPV|nr:putative dna topoisomerase ii protein [Neofusicoccum parvum UCRNP2]
MSSDEDSVFNVSDGSDFEEAPTKKAPAKPAKKPAAPKRAAPKKKEPLQQVHNDSFIRDDEDTIMTEASPPPAKAPKAAPGSATEKYQRLTQLEHIIKRPDTYIGSVERDSKHMWVFNSTTESMEMREVSFVPGLYKIFDEILVNAADNKQNDKNMNEIRVKIDRVSGEISVKNNGKGIPIEIHSKEGIYIPELIFGHLLTSSNYDDNQQKVTGGRNGYGAKLCNIFSTEFSLETVDSRVGKKYKQTWTENMAKCGKAKITSYKGDDYTMVSFKPDYAKFGMDGIDDDFEALAKRRVYDIAGTSKAVKVFLNGDRIKLRTFKDYMKMYTKAIKSEQVASGASSEGEKEVILTDNPDERWEIGFAVSDGSFQQVSFVNSIATTSGGTHVGYIADQIIGKLTDIIKKKNKGGFQLKPQHLKNHIFLFVNCLIVNPAFTSQTKEQMTTKVSQFGSKCSVSDNFLKAIAKTEVVNNILHFAQQKADQVLKKSDGGKRMRMNHSKLTDANRAGTKDGYKCTLILTEGDSASLLALAGRATVDPDLFGVFPLRGKMLNVRDASIDQISKNAEIQNIKKFIGLQHKKEYTDTKSLRYGHIMIMTDQDHDGSHIKGLLINFLQVQFPSLLKIEGFLLEFITPIVKVWKGDPKHPKQLKSFFTMPEYEEWKRDPSHQKGWDHKYYKGLGTSKPEDAVEYFQDLDRHLKEFHTMKDQEAELIDLAFSKKKADARKEWLRNFVPGTYLDMSASKISYEDFVNKELILFSMVDNLRSIPSVIDGFKPGQRKVLYTCFKRNLKKDIKVNELAGFVSGLTNYAYGDASLQQTIVGLAQNFVGSNNINLLEPSGNFGSRIQGGSDAASARYIYTRLSPIARRLFNASDEPLLEHDQDDGKPIEPTMYVPILPMILVNGADGIGTGWSSSIPNYNPKEIVENLKRRMVGHSKEDMVRMMPWFKNWTGTIEDVGGERYKFTGTITQTGDLEVEIAELPIRVWTQDFKDKLEDIIKAEKSPSFIKDYNEYHTLTKVRFVIKMSDPKAMATALEMGLDERFKLYKTMATSNLVAFDHEGRIHKYATELDILEEFYMYRLKFYEKRKQNMLDEMQKELEKLSNQSRFIKMIIDGKLVVSKKKKAVLVAELKKLAFKAIPKNEAKKQGEEEAFVDEEDDSDNEPGANDYDYLLGMAIWSLTQERVEKLLKQIGDKEAEVDILIKKSPKDLWTEDLDDFVEEYDNLLAYEENEAKKSGKKGRRASAKLRIGPNASKKRKADDSDDDFQLGKSKKKAAPKQQSSVLSSYFSKYDDNATTKEKEKEKTPVTTAEAKVTAKSKTTQPKTNLLSSYLSKHGKASNKDDSDSIMEMDDAPEVADGSESNEPVTATATSKSKSKAKATNGVKPVPKAKKASAPSEESDSENDVFADAPSQPKTTTTGRKAAAKAKKAMVLSDESEEDDEVEEAPPKSKAKATTSTKPGAKGKKMAVLSDESEEDDVIEEAPPKSKAKAATSTKPAAKGKKALSDESDDDEDVFAAVGKETKAEAATRKPRAAAAKKKSTYVMSDSDSDEEMVDDGLGDVSSLVKGINGPSETSARPLFSASKSRAKGAGLSTVAVGRTRPSLEDSDHDESQTDYTLLAPQPSPQRQIPRTANDTILSDDDVDMEDEPKTKTVAKPRGKPAASKTTAPKAKAGPSKAAAKVTEKMAEKPKALSPAAKAYARGRPARAAAAKKIVIEDDDDDEDDFDDDESEASEDDFDEDSE